MNNFNLPKGLLDAVTNVVKGNKQEPTPLTGVAKTAAEVHRTGKKDVQIVETKKTPDLLLEKYKSVVENDRKKAAEEQTAFVKKAGKLHMGMGRSIVEAMGSKPRNAREKELAKKHGDPTVITHGDVLKARGVVKEEDIENLVKIMLSYAATKRHNIALSEQREAVMQIARTFVLAFDKMVEESRAEGEMLKAYHNAKEEIRFSMINAVNLGAALNKVNEMQKVASVVAKHTNKIAKPKAEEPASKDIKANPSTDPYESGNLKSRKVKAQADVADEVQREGEMIDEVIAEEKDTPGNSYEHQCAIHVKHSKLGEGRTLFSQHAEPAEDGTIEWYDVMFEHGIEKKVPITDLEILVSESHMNHKKKK